MSSSQMESVTEPQSVPQQAATAPAEIANKETSDRARDSQGRFVPLAVQPTNPNVENANQIEPNMAIATADTKNQDSKSSSNFLSNIADRVEKLANSLTPEVSGELVNTFEEIVKAHVDVHKLLNIANNDTKELRSKCKTLEEDNENMRAERKAEFGKMASQIADALSDIYMQYNGSPMEQSCKDELKMELDKNPKMAKTLQGLPMATVAMSAQRQMAEMGSRVQSARVETAVRNESSLTQKLRDYQMELSTLQNAGATPSMSQSEIMKPSSVEPIAVSASEKKYGASYKMLPPALRDCISKYDSSCGSGRLNPDDYTNENLVKRPRVA
ncbi:hypothetical protein CYMTET_42763 [Cymbomonas tetramitiformis]|uniref:Uncharacterized protein n=1 Tax=Cymbomonas tetramitiformis TaxID=36881 RepID=A0AAE0C566_9CHLO|nr:hypothetical protein CYMTET_42763 [Cymbomonas tetramitiformis]